MAEPLAYSVGMWTTKSDQSNVFVKIWEDMAHNVIKNIKDGIDFTLTQDADQSIFLFHLVAGKVPMYLKSG